MVNLKVLPLLNLKIPMNSMKHLPFKKEPSTEEPSKSTNPIETSKDPNPISNQKNNTKATKSIITILMIFLHENLYYIQYTL
jgi:hypothetical protein